VEWTAYAGAGVNRDLANIEPGRLRPDLMREDFGWFHL
jgi:hypothetical protein